MAQKKDKKNTKETAIIKLQIAGGKATPAPPLGPALGQRGVNIMEFCKAYNAATADKVGEIIPVVITVNPDKTFTFVLKTPPVSTLILKALGVSKGSPEPNKIKIGTLTQDQVGDIAKIKMVDLNAKDEPMAKRIIEGTARSMGVEIAS